mgnify:CR=1 FL=1
MDLDGFKAVNDQYGHDAGNYCLCQLASRMSSVLNDVDTVARIGGDEFAIIVIAPKDEEAVTNPAMRIIERVNSPIKVNGYKLHVGISIGICFYPDDCDTMEELIKKADIALYDAKSSGKNKVVLYNADTHYL